MKGILKGLRYIQDMFDEKEQEMQIGNPTDVKHVAHIGMDGPSASKPSWMSEYNSAQELSSDTLANDLQDGDLGNQESLPPTEKQKKPRRKVSIENGHGTAIESPKGSENGEKQRRPRSTNQEPSSQGRRHSIRKTDGESPSNDLPDIPKKSRRKKSKGSAGGSEGESSSRSKPGSLPDVAELES
ncbi:ROP-interactive CRIB motif-containing protein 1 [Hibiscus trionum]|uniref:ROP-interactive CRIB motif-containing protein 1 n=1 Tax=Hibiscus trionum TaxID=183268 RepID=A0A9W7IZM5_HIBTR|nr:ROP-interactive CRIB motif-containing protein 1 [Hibiscus trionum]